MARKVRRVVTGVDAAGKSVFVSDEPVDATTLTLLPGSAFHKLWGADVVPSGNTAWYDNSTDCCARLIGLAATAAAPAVVTNSRRSNPFRLVMDLPSVH